jgi:putative transposase
VKIREVQVANRPFYVSIGVTTDGTRDILGLWVGDGGEGAKYWAHVLTEIKNRGTKHVCIPVCDGLTGLPDAVNTVWPQTIVQACGAPTAQQFPLRQPQGLAGHRERPQAHLRRRHRGSRPGRLRRVLRRLWENARAEFVPFLSFANDIREVIYTTNAIESVYARIRRAVKARGHFRPSRRRSSVCTWLS